MYTFPAKEHLINRFAFDVQHTKRVPMQSVDTAGPDQPAQMCRLISAFIVHLQKQRILKYMSVKRILRSDCMDGYADLNLHCLQIA